MILNHESSSFKHQTCFWDLQLKVHTNGLKVSRWPTSLCFTFHTRCSDEHTESNIVHRAERVCRRCVRAAGMRKLEAVQHQLSPSAAEIFIRLWGHLAPRHISDWDEEGNMLHTKTKTLSLRRNSNAALPGHRDVLRASNQSSCRRSLPDRQTKNSKLNWTASPPHSPSFL